MTWAVVGGVRVWNHKTFVEPSDAELLQYGWSRGVKPSTGRRAKPVLSLAPNTCMDCPTQIERKSKRCKPCHLKSMVAASLSGATRREEVDEMVVAKILRGDWVRGTKTTKAEKVATVAAWCALGRAKNELRRVTGWRVERYTPRIVKDVAA